MSFEEKSDVMCGIRGRLGIKLIYHNTDVVKYGVLYEHIFAFRDHLMPEHPETVADKLRYYRKKNSLLQKDMAFRLGIDRGTYIRYECSGISCYPSEIIEKCALIFGVPAEQLLDGYNLFIYRGQGSEIRKKRCSLGLTQGEFAMLYGVSKNTVVRWENNTVRISRKLWERIFGNFDPAP